MKITSLVIPCFIMVVAIFSTVQAQENFENWMHEGPDKNFPNGVRSAEWYSTAPASKGKTVIVAVLDSGVDIDHPDLKGHIWTNPGEIPGNGKDDDGNGYIDDVHGWNFLGGKNGDEVIKETLEITREYARQKKMWEGVNPDKLKGKKKAAYDEYLEMQKTIEDKLAGTRGQLEQMEQMRQMIVSSIESAKKVLGDDTLDVMKLITSDDEGAQLAAKVIQSVEEQGVKVESLDWLMEQANAQFEEEIADSRKTIDYNYNVDYNSRTIVGDHYDDFNDQHYGNNHVNGPFAYHGTHVSGIIGALRNNQLGMDGIADNVVIMPIKAVPDGDERDKDIALGIRYAVNNGAQVINMSFGKGYSPQKEWVDDAMKYAAKHDVLLVHGSGNEGADIDVVSNFPNDTYRKKGLFGPKRAPNVITVGALSPEGGEASVAEFSNYGKREVDVFAPGVYIYSTVPDTSYDYASGTSMATPVVSGIAALLRSRYPELSAVQVKDILMQSTRPLPDSVIEPGTFEKVSSHDLSVSGGMVDVVRAMQIASVTKGKANPKKRIKPEGYQMPSPKV